MNNFPMQLISIISLQKYFRNKLSDFNRIKIPYLQSTDSYTGRILKEDGYTLCGLSWKSYSKELGNEKSILLDDLSIILNLNNA